MSESPAPKSPGAVFAGQATTIFTVMSALAAKHEAINLGQGFPDEDGPLFMRERAARALIEGPNQYPPMRGLMELRAAVAAHDKRFYGLDLDPAREVLVTSGATEALTDALLGLLDPGDEAIVFEPVYDSYRPMIERAGATAVAVRLDPPGWALPRAALEAAFGPRTKLIVVNSPMNPCGKVFSDDELAFIADLCVRHDAFAVGDEVYEHLTFDGRRHRPLLTVPGLEGRALKVGSAGKTFALTGWKIGYLSGPAPLIDAVAQVHQFNTFTTPPALQIAVAEGLGAPDSYFEALRGDLERKRDLLAQGLGEIGFRVGESEGTYFLTCDYSGLGLRGTPDEVCITLTREARVAAIPLSAFYKNGDCGPYIRFCFCKADQTLNEALARLRRFFERRP